MSTLTELSIFPLDKGDSVSTYVSKVVEMIRDSGFTYQLTAMGTLIETDTINESLHIIQKAHDILSQHSERIYCTTKFDIQKGKSNRIFGKIKSIEEKIGNISK